MSDIEKRKLEVGGQICNSISLDLSSGHSDMGPGFGDVKSVNLSQMRFLYECGALARAVLAPAPMESGFIMIVERKDGKDETMSVTKGDRHKIYKSLEAAREDAKRIGFVEVILKVA